MLILNRIFILLLLLLNFYATPAYSLEDGIIAVVNDELITLNDLKNYIKSTQMNLSAQRFDPADVERYMQDLEKNGLEKLIEDKLILSKANQIQLSINDALVQEKMEEYKKRYPSEEVFMQSLIAHGGTLTDMHNKIIEQLKLKYVIDYEVSSKIFVNPYEITNYYNDNKDDFRTKESVDLDSIYVGFNDDRESAKTKIGNAQAALKTGSDFKDVASKYSDTPSIGIIEKGQMVKSIEDAVFNLNTGEISDIVETDTGYFIFKLNKKNKEKIAPLSEVKPLIKNKVYEKKFREEYAKWLKQLKENAYIEIKK